jgi:hypothetical protein
MMKTGEAFTIRRDDTRTVEELDSLAESLGLRLSELLAY